MFSSPGGGFPWDDLCQIFSGCQRLAKVPNAVEILPKISTAWVGRTKVTDDRQTTDGREIAYSENRRTAVTSAWIFQPQFSSYPVNKQTNDGENRTPLSSGEVDIDCHFVYVVLLQSYSNVVGSTSPNRDVEWFYSAVREIKWSRLKKTHRSTYVVYWANKTNRRINFTAYRRVLPQ